MIKNNILRNKKGQIYVEILILILFIVFISWVIHIVTFDFDMTNSKNLLCQKEGYINYEYKNNFGYCYKYLDNDIIYKAAIFQCKKSNCYNITFINNDKENKK